MIYIIHFVVSYLFLAVLFSMNTAEELIYTSLFKGFAGYRVRNPFTSFTFSSGHFSECCVRCLQYQNCYSVNIRRDDRFCEINTLGSNGYGDLVDKNGTWTLFVRTNVPHNELMFRATPGVGLSVKDSWLGNIIPPTAQDTCISMKNTSCSTHYRNPRVDIWESLSISQVTLELYKHGSKVAFIAFDGKDSTIENWFNSSRILNSSWSNVTPSTIYNYFSIKGHSECSRSFFVNTHYHNCSVDTGYMVVVDPPTACCPWENVPNKPQFFYSAADGTVTYQSGSTDLGTAEVMAVFVNIS
eukprot:XP_019927466.1 PREDICTED: uncharacterized protein LOC105339732 isoform X2 [Crassostrea gigas]